MASKLRELADEMDVMQLATIRAAQTIVDLKRNTTEDTKLLNIAEQESARLEMHFLTLLSLHWKEDLRSTLRAIAASAPIREPQTLALPEDFEGLQRGNDHRQTQQQEQGTEESVPKQRYGRDLPTRLPPNQT